MESVNYRDRLDDAVRRALAATSPAARAAYLELARFYRDKLTYDAVQPRSSAADGGEDCPK